MLAAPPSFIATTWRFIATSFKVYLIGRQMTSIADYTLDQRLSKTDLLAVGQKAKAAANILALAPTSQRNEALRAAASSLRAHIAEILNTNAADRKAAREAGRPESFIERLTLTEARIEAMARGLDEIAALPDPVGEVTAAWERPNGLTHPCDIILRQRGCWI